MPCRLIEAALPHLRRCGNGSGGPLLGTVEPWSCGFRQPRSTHEHLDQHFLKDAALSASLAQTMSRFWLSSDTDVPFFPFIGQADPAATSEEALLLSSIGLSGVIPVRIRNITARTSFEWDDDEFPEDDPITDYHTGPEIKAYKQTTDEMHARLTGLWMADFIQVDVVHPVFWYGTSDSGNLVGLFSVRTDT